MADYTTIDDPSAHFQTAIYTGDGNADRAIVNDGNSDLQPDWVWYKSRSHATSHITYDSSRGDGPYLKPSDAGDEGTDANMFESFDSDGFSLNGDTDGNGSGRTYVAWQWKANGGTTTSFSESGNNPGGARQTNTDAGFSIITYTGTGANASCALAHGLPSTPEMIFFKRRNADQVWATWHQGIGDDYKLELNGTGGKDADGAFMNSTLPDSTNIYVGGTSVNTNADNGTYVCYAFSPVQGYSKFGSYVGNGDANGSFVYTGFKPAMIILKRTDATNNWLIYDHKRSGYNPKQDKLYPDDASAEDASTTSVDLLSNGFKLRASSASQNASGGTYIYMAFAENPFVANGKPTTAR